MAYIDGFVVAVPAGNQDPYLALAAKCAPLFREFGAGRLVEAWQDQMPEGKLTDFRRAVLAEQDEVVVFSWVEYPDRTTRDAAGQKMMSDPRTKEMSENMPFDGKRMVIGGFDVILDEGPGGPMGYVDGMLAPVRADDREDYLGFFGKAAGAFLDHGATRVVHAWGDDLPDGKVTDHRRAVQAKDGENVIFAWIEWPSRDAREAGWQKATQDPRMQPGHDMPFDGARAIFGGFTSLLDA